MREHALPQDVTGYRFHIIGNMTLKQFAEVASGCVIAFILYRTNLPIFIKFPLVGFSAGFGALVAFVPIEERPFDQWILAFFRALYRPTQFYWKRSQHLPDSFTFKSKMTAVNLEPQVDLAPMRRQRVKEYLRSIDADAVLDPIEQYSVQRLDEVMQAFQAPASQGVVPVESADTLSSIAPPAPDVVGADSQAIVEPTYEAQIDTATAPQTYNDLLPTEVPQEPAAPVQVNPTEIPLPQTMSEEQFTANQNDSVNPADLAQTQSEALNPVATAFQNPALPFPAKPTEPNIVVGMVLDQANQPQPNVIVEILTETGLPARAVKTNVLGQFFITTPLQAGRYVLRAEKDGLQFLPLELIIQNQILEPIEVRAS